MTEGQNKIIELNKYYLKKYLELYYPNTKETLYRDFCINYADYLKSGGDVDIESIGEMLHWYIDDTLKRECDLYEGR